MRGSNFFPESPSVINKGLITFAAGTLSGVSSILASQPIDVVRVRQQVATRSISMMDCFRSVLKNDGPLGLYKGTVPPACATGFLMATMFTVQQATKHSLLRPGSRELTWWDHCLCGAAGGAAQSVFATPIEFLKVRQQTASRQGRAASLRGLLRGTNVRWMYRAYVPLLLRDSIGYGLFLGTTEATIQHLNGQVGPGTLVLMGVTFAGTFYWFPTYPLDVIKTRLQNDNFAAPRYAGFFDCVRQARREPIAKLYRGLSTTLCYAVPRNGVKIFVFYRAKAWLESRV